MRLTVDGTTEFVLQNVQNLALEVSTLTLIRELLALEKHLSELMSQVCSTVLIDYFKIFQKQDSFEFAGPKLQKIKRSRMDLVSRLARNVRYPLLLTFLESFMDSLVATEQSFERLLSRYFLRSEATDMDNLVLKQDLLSEKDRAALKAGKY